MKKDQCERPRTWQEMFFDFLKIKSVLNAIIKAILLISIGMMIGLTGISIQQYINIIKGFFK